MEVKDYYPDGTLEFTKYITRDGEVHEKYYENGQMKYKHMYRNDKPYGKQKGWYKNGKVKYEGNYDDLGREHGMYVKKNKNGEVVERINYVHGVEFSKY